MAGIAGPDGGDYMIDIFTSGLSEAVPLTAEVYGSGDQEIVATYAGNANYTSSASNPVYLTGSGVNPPAPSFTVAANPTSISSAAGNTGTGTISVTPQNGFSSAVQLVCSGLPASSSCSFSPTSVTPNGSAATTSLTIATDVQTASNKNSKSPLNLTFLSIAFFFGFGSFAGLPILSRFTRQSIGQRGNPWCLFFVLTGALRVGVLTGCGGGSGGGKSGNITPAGTSTITVTAVSAGSSAITATTTFTLTITN